MKKIRPIDRMESFWGGAFLVAYGEILRRVPPGEALLQGPKYAALARSFADDCERVRQASDAAGPDCPDCRGIGCAACRYTGRASPGPGLVVPTLNETLNEVHYTCSVHGGSWPAGSGNVCPACGAGGWPLSPSLGRGE